MIDKHNIEVGAIFYESNLKAVPFIVTAVHTNKAPDVELLDDYIMKNYMIKEGDDIITLKELVEREKAKILAEAEDYAEGE